MSSPGSSYILKALVDKLDVRVEVLSQKLCEFVPFAKIGKRDQTIGEKSRVQ